MKNFYTLYGLDKILIKNEINKIISKLKINDVVWYDIDNTSLIEVVEDASTVSMFGDKKIIVLENCSFLSPNKGNDNLEILEEYLEHYNSNNYCILICYTEKIDSRKKINKLLEKNGKVCNLSKIDNSSKEKFISDYLKDYNKKLESSSYFLSKVGNDFGNIKNELDKLIMYKPDDNIITNDDIDKITIKSAEEEIFALTDAVIAKNITLSLSLLDEFLNKGYDEMQIIILLAGQFRFLYQVKRLLNKNKSNDEIAKILEVNPYRIKFTEKKLYNYTERELLEFIKKLAKIDHDIKLGLADKNLALKIFIIGNNNSY